MTPAELTQHLETHHSTRMAGVSLSLLIFVILTGQVGLYFWRRCIHGSDPAWIKGIVVLVWVMQALETALACRMSIGASQQVYNTPAEGLALISYAWGIYVATCSTTTFLVHILFVRRIYLLGKSVASTKLPVIIGLVVVTEEAFGLLSTASVARIHQTNLSSVRLWPIVVWLGLSITADALISGSLCYVLSENRIGSPRTDYMIKRLMSFCVQTGLITSLVAGVTVAIWAAAKLEIRHLSMSFPVGGIYATCLMANFIARESYLHPRLAYEDTELQVRSTTGIVFAEPDNAEKSLTSFLVHVIFVRRIYLLCEKLYGDRKLSSVIGLVTMLEGGFGLVSTVFVARINQDNSPYGPLKWPIPLWLGCSGTADALIACTLCCIFNANRTGSPQSELIINRLVKFCVQTGLITFLTAGTTVAIWEAADFDIFHLLMSFPMGGIYATCLMANFLARESYLRPRCAPEDVENMGVAGGTVVASEDLRCPSEKSSVKSGMKDTSIRSVSEST
ncbi:hypothetical protein HYDPIDRAFT_38299 [Hydnomerulius pinastri MD-312]|nr:hypothetical protein HYDPIDRAFT_38299 [Hydnomerulius pinastri MD-312]